MRLFAVLAAALALAACQPSPSAVTADDNSMGSAAAPVTMIEYASLSCPHCANFNNEVFPAFKAKYIDTGKVRYVLREALTADPAIALAGFLTAHCAGPGKYFQLVDAIYHIPSLHEEGEGAPQPPHQLLQQVAESAGIPDQKFEACIRDEAAQKGIEDRWQRYVADEKIDNTPTFVINGKTYNQGAMTLAQLDAAVAAAKSGK